MNSNPLLNFSGLPSFSKIKAEHVEPAIDQLLQESREQVEALLVENVEYGWENMLKPLELINEKLNRVWSPVSHMNSVVNSDELRDSYNQCLPKLSQYATEMGQNSRLYNAYKAVSESEEFKTFNDAQRKIVQNALRDFHLSGVDLPENEKKRFKEIQKRLSELTSQFDQNVLDATQGWYKSIDDESLLSGLPETVRNLAKQAAEEKQQEGWVLTLDFPCYYPTMLYADDAKLREEMYTAYATRASDVGANAGKWDNSKIMDEIIALRHESATLLGFNNFVEKSLAKKMAKDANQVFEFLESLVSKSLPEAKREFEELKEYASENFSVSELNAWDVPYYSEKLRQHQYAISQEMLKPYFSEESVLSGLFEVVNRLYGISISQKHDVDVWHKDVRFYEIVDSDNKIRGQFFLDLYARANKRGGAWMDECLSRMKIDEISQVPVAYLTCNFSPPIGEEPALFTHNEVNTLFHEFGHGLHHMLTKVDYPSVAGISGVPWDAVELPSQFLENWCWEKEALDGMALHYKTQEKLPDELYDKMIAAKNFQSGMQMVRQLEFALFDIKIHMQYSKEKGAQIYSILKQVRDDVAVFQPPEFNRFAHGFSHIFAGGYAAGYYSYKWAEVLSADAYSRFEEDGIFNAETGAAFLNNILERGGSYEPMDLFIKFRGREPNIDALLRHSGIAA